MIGKSKRLGHKFERITNELKVWNEKLLSRAGKEVLIKSVIQAIPTHTMSLFLFPASICRDIEKVIAQFWRRSKQNGGLGFREFRGFNSAMITKQCWRILTNPESLAARLLKAKQCPRTDFTQVTIGYQPGDLWRSLLAASQLVVEDSTWRFGDRTRVDIRNDRWTGMDNYLKPTVVQDSMPEKACVNVLIDLEASRRNFNIIRQAFIQSDANRIISMPLSGCFSPHKRTWRLTKNGRFSLKSAYHLAVSMFSSAVSSRTSSGSSIPGWTKLGQIPVIPEIKHFLWRACKDSLPTKEKLFQRGGVTDPICVLCGEGVESIFHVLFQCRQTKNIWRHSPLRLALPESMIDTFRSFFWLIVDDRPLDYLCLFGTLAWSIWMGRNKVCFEKSRFSFQNTCSNLFEKIL